jgi:hypothetical protein
MYLDFFIKYQIKYIRIINCESLVNSLLMSIYDKFGFPRTINNEQCKSSCFNKHTAILNNLDGDLDNFEKNMCRISNINNEYDECKSEDANKDENYLNYIQIDEFDHNVMLKYVYGLNSFEEVIMFSFENANLPVNTLIRIHDCAWLAYGKNFLNLSDIVINYYYNLAEKSWGVQNLTIESFRGALKKYYEENIKDWFDIGSHYWTFRYFIKHY